MSKGRTNTIAQEVENLLTSRGNNKWSFIESVLQIIDREKIIALNKYLEKRGEPLIIPEPRRYKIVNQTDSGWIVDVPKSWDSLAGWDEYLPARRQIRETK